MNKAIIISLVLAVIFSSCEDNSENVIPADEAPSKKNEPGGDAWMNGGGRLYAAKVIDWRSATSDQKLATSAGFLKKSDSVPSPDLMREHAESLVKCINQSVEGMLTMSDDPIAEVAAACLASMGYLNEDDPERLEE